MLIGFYFENFRSFQDCAHVEMIANEKIEHSLEHVYRDDTTDIDLLHGALVLGRTDSGKSNFVNAFKFAADMVLSGAVKFQSNKQCYLCTDRIEPVGLFKFDLLFHGCVYTYVLAINYLTATIEVESLYCFDQMDDDVDTDTGADFCMFKRGKNEHGEMEFDSDFLNPNYGEIAERFKTYQLDYVKDGLAHTLFLSDICKRIAPDCLDLSGFIEVFNWFKSIVFLSNDFSIWASPADVDADKELNDLATKLQGFDIGISSLKMEEADFTNALRDLPEVMVKAIQERVSQILDNNQNCPVKIYIESLGSLFEVRRDANGKFLYSQLVAAHGSHIMDFEQESVGARRLLCILAAISMVKEGSLVLVDDLNRGLHSLVVSKLIELMYQLSAEHKWQFLAATHCDDLLDEAWLRNDEFLVVNRDPQYQSSGIVALDHCPNLDSDNRRQAYLSGKYQDDPFMAEVLSFLKYAGAAGATGIQDPSTTGDQMGHGTQNDAH